MLVVFLLIVVWGSLSTGELLSFGIEYLGFILI